MTSGGKGLLMTRVSSVIRILMKVLSDYELLWRSTKQGGVQIDQVPGILQEALVRGLKLHIYISPLVEPCPKN